MIRRSLCFTRNALRVIFEQIFIYTSPASRIPPFIYLELLISADNVLFNERRRGERPKQLRTLVFSAQYRFCKSPARRRRRAFDRSAFANISRGARGREREERFTVQWPRWAEDLEPTGRARPLTVVYIESHGHHSISRLRVHSPFFIRASEALLEIALASAERN